MGADTVFVRSFTENQAIAIPPNHTRSQLHNSSKS